MGEPEKPESDEYWWAPWAILALMLVFGLLGFMGVLWPKRTGPSAADIPVVIPAPSSSAEAH